MSAALALAAVAILVLPGTAWPLQRLQGASTARTTDRTVVTDGPFAAAAAYDLLAVCLRAGLSTVAAVSAVAHAVPPPVAAPLHRVADLLALGTDAEAAWQRAATDHPDLGDLAALVRRTSSSGAAFARGLDGLAAHRRDEAHDAALAEAERAGVRISGPLGLCFLPAFICVGIAPVVIGLAATVLGGI